MRRRRKRSITTKKMLFRVWVALVAIMLLMFLFGIGAGLNLAPADEAGCPPQIEAATRVRLFFSELPPDLTNQDNEFSELCGLNWRTPVRIEPLSRGA